MVVRMIGCDHSPFLFDLASLIKILFMLNMPMHTRSQGALPIIPEGLTFEQRCRWIQMTEVDRVKRQRRMLRQAYMQRQEDIYNVSLIQAWFRRYRDRRGFGRFLANIYTTGYERYNYLCASSSPVATVERTMLARTLIHIQKVRRQLEFSSAQNMPGFCDLTL